MTIEPLPNRERETLNTAQMKIALTKIILLTTAATAVAVTF